MPSDTAMVNQLLLKLEPDWGTEKIEKLRLLYQLGDEERKERIERMLAIAVKTKINDNLLGNKVLLPPSTRAECYGRGEIYMGEVCYGKNNSGNDRVLYPLYLDFEDLKNHMIITGLSGTGKTTLGYNLALELAKRNINVIVFDWDRTWRNFLSLPETKYPFVKDIRIFTIGRDDIAGFRWNLFFCPPPGVSLSSWIGIASSKPLQKSMLAGQGVEDFLENTAETLINEYKEGMLKLLPNIEDIKNRIMHKHARARQLLWKQSAERVLRELTRESIREVFGSRKPIDISKEILEKKGINIIEMDIETPESARILIQELLLIYFMLYFLHKGEAEKEKLRVEVICEEFGNMLGESKIEKQVGSPIIKNIFKEGRKFGMGLMAIAQESSELPNYVTANAKIQAHFSLITRRDIESSAGSLFLKPEQIPFMDLIWRGEALVKVKGRVKNCLVKIPPSPIKEKITDEQLKEIKRKWPQQS